jgi:hypothetical protein
VRAGHRAAQELIVLDDRSTVPAPSQRPLTFDVIEPVRDIDAVVGLVAVHST